MAHRYVPVLFVALLVVTAGCLGGGGPPAGPQSGGGSGGGGGADAATLVGNQTAALLEAGSYTTSWRLQSTEDGEVVSELAYTTAIDLDAERFHFTSTIGADEGSRTASESFYADGTNYQRFGSGEDVGYVQTEGTFGTTAQYGRSPAITGTGDLSEFTRSGTETVDGVQVTRYVLEERASWVAGQLQADEDVRWTDFTYEVLVDGDGLVRSERWTSGGVDDDGVAHAVQYTYTVTGVGSTDVPDPDWLDDARRSAGQA
jgi:hypothetical protein